MSCGACRGTPERWRVRHAPNADEIRFGRPTAWPCRFCDDVVCTLCYAEHTRTPHLHGMDVGGISEEQARELASRIRAALVAAILSEGG